MCLRKRRKQHWIGWPVSYIEGDHSSKEMVPSSPHIGLCCLLAGNVTQEEKQVCLSFYLQMCMKYFMLFLSYTKHNVPSTNTG